MSGLDLHISYEFCAFFTMFLFNSRVREDTKMTPQTGNEGEVKSAVGRGKAVRTEVSVKNGIDGGRKGSISPQSNELVKEPVSAHFSIH